MKKILDVDIWSVLTFFLINFHKGDLKKNQESLTPGPVRHQNIEFVAL